ncbi:Hypothetical predicted protein [Olea europaea subsp. europaea]|uniref:Uncharacterized protein n=1 Tax=Olea europaea subsp. europaea TaxID=158383 RepID=A0A8S0UF91_OLEEU|nr:Hypothetical predicted protein [Olea europaea subsp. europaea]
MGITPNNLLYGGFLAGDGAVVLTVNRAGYWRTDSEMTSRELQLSQFLTSLFLNAILVPPYHLPTANVMPSSFTTPPHLRPFESGVITAGQSDNSIARSMI